LTKQEYTDCILKASDEAHKGLELISLEEVFEKFDKKIKEFENRLVKKASKNFVGIFNFIAKYNKKRGFDIIQKILTFRKEQSNPLVILEISEKLWPILYS